MDRKVKQTKRIRRHRRVRAKIYGTKEVPRLCVFRSNQHIYAQLINDEKGNVLTAASDLELNVKRKTQSVKPQRKAKNSKQEPEKTLKGKTLIAYKVGQLIAQKAIKKKIKKVIFDRGGYKYHGRVKSLAEGARDAGLKF